MDKFTKGPWKTFNTADLPETRFLVGKYWPQAGAYQCVASCDHKTTHGASGDEALANAALIAAAPDMFEALESAKSWMEQLRALHSDRESTRTAWPMPGMGARYREICAALAKASAQ